jgi:hypothetical protein
VNSRSHRTTIPVRFRLCKDLGRWQSDEFLRTVVRYSVTGPKTSDRERHEAEVENVAGVAARRVMGLFHEDQIG